MKIFISSDHGGYKLKNFLAERLRKDGLDIEDLGPTVLNPEDDYPDYVKPLVEKVVEAQDGKGILICRNGVGVTIAANKHPKIRAGLSWNKEHAISSRNDDNTNVLTLPADYISEEEAYEISKTWLEAGFSAQPRYMRRLAKLENLA